MENNNEVGMMETDSEDISEVMDTNIAGSALTFVKENGAAIAVIGFAVKGAIDTGKWVAKKIKAKMPEKTDKPKKPTLRERIQAKRNEKNKPESKPEEEKAE